METNNETQRVINGIMEHFTNTINEPDFLNNMQKENIRAYFIKHIEQSLKMVATQKAIDIKNSISTLNL
jgi:hypothetical protein